MSEPCGLNHSTYRPHSLSEIQTPRKSTELGQLSPICTLVASALIWDRNHDNPLTACDQAARGAPERHSPVGGSELQQVAAEPAGGPAFVGSSGSREAPQGANVVDVVDVVLAAGCVVVVEALPLLCKPRVDGLAELPPDPQAVARIPTRATPRRRVTTLLNRSERVLIVNRTPGSGQPALRTERKCRA